jgi:hypothetical protein
MWSFIVDLIKVYDFYKTISQKGTIHQRMLSFIFWTLPPEAQLSCCFSVTYFYVCSKKNVFKYLPHKSEDIIFHTRNRSTYIAREYAVCMHVQ